MPRKPTTRTLVPPTLGEDAAERKRVLNILAQRRYRRRKKERLQALEARAQTSDSSRDSLSRSGTEPGTTRPSQRTQHEELATSPKNAAFSTKNDGIPPNASLAVGGTQHEKVLSAHGDNPISPAIFDSIPTDLDSELFLEFPDMVPQDTLLQTEGWPDFDLVTWDTDGLESQLGTQQICNPKAINDLSAALQTEDTLSFTFPDDRVLEVPSLTLLNAAMTVAQRLNISNLIWDLSAISPFYQESSAPSPSSISSRPSFTTPSQESESLSASSHESSNPPANFDALPSHLRPTSIQRLIPHHPILDLLPWPSTRNKLIQVFSLPAEVRPSSAQDPMALLQLVHDLEDDGGEGVRVHGRDPFELHAWEIGQIMLERWWWAFETGVIERSNRARVNRGQKHLTLTGQGL